MVKLIITDRIHKGIAITQYPAQFITTRPLSIEEIALTKQLKLKRFYYRQLDDDESNQFLSQFDEFWDNIVRLYGDQKHFWRSAFASKMQEWERSLAYLCLCLFTLSKTKFQVVSTCVIICSDVLEENLFEQFGKKMGWKTYRISSSSTVQRYRFWVQRLKLFVRFQRIFLSLCFHKLISPKSKLEYDFDHKYVLICSLIYSHSLTNNHFSDPFFGEFHRHCRRKGISVVYLVYPLDNYKQTVRKINNYSEKVLLVPLSVIDWKTFFKTALGVFSHKYHEGNLNFLGCDLSKIVLSYLRREYFFNMHSEIFHQATKSICKDFHFVRLIFPYEGNAFERSVIQAFKNQNNGKTIGYSHGVVYPLNIKLRLTKLESQLKPMPDMIVTTGPENSKELKSVLNYDSLRIRDGCSLKSAPEIDNFYSKKNMDVVLVALDGVWSTVSLLDWLIEHAERLKTYQFKVRCHPNVPLFRKKYGYHNLPPNFTFSAQPLKNDLANSLCVIYRQTSVGLLALMNNIPAIHLKIDAPLPCDPVPGLKAGKWIAGDIEELTHALSDIRFYPDVKIKQAMQHAREYAQSYFRPPNDEIMDLFFNGSLT